MLNFSLPRRYEDALVLLLTEVLNRIQFRYNQAQLEELDDETLDDDVSRASSPALVAVASGVRPDRLGACKLAALGPE